MKILVLAAATYADPHTRKLFDHIAARGHEVILAMPRRIKHPFAPAEVPDTPWPTPGVRLVKLDTWYLHENGTHILMKGVRRLIRDERPDVIHCEFEPWALTCLQVRAAMRGMEAATAVRGAAGRDKAWSREDPWQCVVTTVAVS